MLTHTLVFTHVTKSFCDTVVSLTANGEKVAEVQAGGYCQHGQLMAKWLLANYQDRLLALPPETFDNGSYFVRSMKPSRICLACGTVEPKGKYRAVDTVRCPRCGRPTDIDPRDGEVRQAKPRIPGLYYRDVEGETTSCTPSAKHCVPAIDATATETMVKEIGAALGLRFTYTDQDTLIVTEAR